MAVFTKISDEQFTKILSNYNIGKFIKAEGISEGVENTNYRIHTDQNHFILTVYEQRVDEEDLPFFMGLQKSLNSTDFPCPKPIEDNDDRIINKIDNKSYTIVSFIKGSWTRNITNNSVREIAKTLAMLHNQTSSISDLSRDNSMNKNFWFETYGKVKIIAEETYPDLKSAMAIASDKINKSWPENLPEGIIHADYFPDNVMFNNSKVSGVIDFYMSCVDIYIYDLAIALNAWCFEKDFSFNITKAKIFLNAYNNERKLSDQELEYLPILCIGASVRFLSTRLFDKFNSIEAADITPKDPREYIEKLKFHLQVSNFSDYGI